MNKLFLLFAFLTFASFASAQSQTFKVTDASKIYDVVIETGKCEDDLCSGKATVYLQKKNQTKVFQKIEMPEMYLRLDTAAQAVKGSPLELSKEEIYGVSFVDFNFDGVEDLQIANGQNAPYGGVSFDVFLFAKTSGKFVKHQELTMIMEDNTSVDINKKRRILETVTKSGCCWYQTKHYKFVKNRLVKIYVQTVDMATEDGGEKVTTEKLVGGRWRKTVKINKMDSSND